MSRRGENIYKRKDGRWEGRYIAGRKPDGSAIYRYLYDKTYKGIKEKKRCAAQEKAALQDAPALGRILDTWLESKRGMVKESTYTRYWLHIERYLRPAFGRLDTNEMTTEAVRDQVQFLLTRGRRDENGGLSPKTVSDLLSILREIAAFSAACGCELPCRLEGLSVKRKPLEMRVFTTEEQAVLTRYLLENTDLYRFDVLICLYTGIRIGELCALQWEHFSLEERKLRICGALQRLCDPDGDSGKRTRIVISSPKSAHSVRTIPLPGFLLPMISAFYGQEQHYFLSGTPKPVEPRVLQYHFKKYIASCKIADANFHALRHTFATRCVEAGFEIKSLSEILGHADVNITLNRYVHSSFTLQASNMEKLSLVL